MIEELVPPHGGRLVNRVLTGEERAAALARAITLPRIRLDRWSASDLEMIAVGAFSPLEGFLTRADYNAVVEEMHLAGGLAWSLPVTLAVDTEEAAGLVEGREAALVGAEQEILGLLLLEEKYRYDREREARLVFRTLDPAHPGVARLLRRGEVLLGGKIWLLNRPQCPFPAYRLDPAETRAVFRQRGWSRVVGFQTRNPVHRAHEYIQKCALEMADGLLLHPLVGETKEDDLPATVRVRSYEVLLNEYYPRDRVVLAIFPAAMRYAGPREAVFHALVRKNYGCSHFIVGRDHAGIGGYYGPDEAQRVFGAFSPGELGVTPLFFETAFYCRRCGSMVSGKTCPHDGAVRLVLSGTEVREMLRRGAIPPPEFTRPEVAAVLIEGLKEYRMRRCPITQPGNSRGLQSREQTQA
ncbi:MAG: sulfate adenylyltransferase [Clostridia bacterium]|nr:sulfate adenylyltransferase [Clostridia bacterium]